MVVDAEDPDSIPFLAAFSADGAYQQADPDGTNGLGAWESTGPTSAALTFVQQFSDEEGNLVGRTMLDDVVLGGTVVAVVPARSLSLSPRWIQCVIRVSRWCRQPRLTMPKPRGTRSDLHVSWSGRRDSNSRPSPWQGASTPTRNVVECEEDDYTGVVECSGTVPPCCRRRCCHT